MSESGIRVKLAVEDPAGCPVTGVSADSGERITEMTRTAANGDGRVVEEFTAPTGAADGHEDVEGVFETGAETRYRFERDQNRACFCDDVERYGCPVADVVAEDGTLVVTFHAETLEDVRDVIDGMSGDYDGVTLRSLRRTGEEASSDAVLVDRDQLTDRQREVLSTAAEMGYFEYPKGANAGEVAAELDISVSTLAEHLAAAQTKVLGDVLEA